MTQIVREYEIHRLLGEGAMGTVFYATNRKLRRATALKVLKPEVAARPGVIQRFEHEAQAQAQLGHHNITAIYDYFQEGPNYYIAMEYVDGRSLADYMTAQRGILPFQEAARLASEALRGLDHAHQKGIIHRDIKPANLLMTQQRQIKVTDFGIARLLGGGRSTREGMIVGTYEYISPEAAQAQEEITGRADQYSLAVVLFEMITGTLPFNNDKGEWELLKMHVQSPRPSVRARIKERRLPLNGDVPSDLDAIIQQAMHVKPTRRFASAGAMAEALDECIRSQGRTAATGIRRLWDSFGGGEAKERPDSSLTILDRRRTDISQITNTVEDLLDKHLWNQADSTVSEALRAHRDDPDLLELRERIRRQKSQYESAVNAQIANIRELLERGLAEAATRQAERAVEQYTRSSALADLLVECRKELEEASERAGEIAKVRAWVEALIAEEKFRQAADYVFEQSALGQNATELSQLSFRIMQAERDAKRKAEIQQCMTEANQQASTGEWEGALAILDEAIPRFQNDPKLKELRGELSDRWQAELKRREVQAALTDAAEFESAGSLKEALEWLLQAVGRIGRDDALLREIARLEAAIEAARREVSIVTAASQVSDLIDQRQWEPALELLDEISAREGSDLRLADLRATAHAELRAHEARVERAATQASSMIKAGDLQKAVMHLSTAMRDMPGEVVLVNLLQETNHALANKRRRETVARVKDDIARKTSENDYATAIQVVFDALAQYPEEKELNDLLGSTISERDAFDHAQRAGAAIEEARTLRESSNFDAAVRILRDALREQPHNSDLERALTETEGLWTQHRRVAAVQEATSAAEAAIASHTYQPALDQIAGVLAAWADDRELLELQKRVATAQHRHAIDTAQALALTRGQSLEEKGEWEAAAAAYAFTVARFPETEAELAPRIEKARGRAAEQRRRERIETLTRNIDKWLQTSLLENASAELAVAERELPDEPVLKDWRAKLDREQQRLGREKAVVETTERVGRLLERRAFEEARMTVQAALARFAPDARLEALLEKARAARAAHDAAVESALQALDGDMEREAWNAAVAAAVIYTEQFPDEPKFRALLIEARDKRDSARRRGEVDRSVENIKALLDCGALHEAETLLRNAQAKNLKSPTLQELAKRLAALKRTDATRAAFRQAEERAREFWNLGHRREARDYLKPFRSTPETAEAAASLLREFQTEEEAEAARASETKAQIAEAEAQANALLAENRPEDAIRALKASLEQLGEVLSLRQLLDRVQQQLTGIRKREQLAAAEEQIRKLFEAQHLEDAGHEVERALASFPGEPSLRDLANAIRRAKEEKRAIGELLETITETLALGDPDEAERLLVDALRRYPQRPEFLSLREHVDAARYAASERQSRLRLDKASQEVERLMEAGQLERAAQTLDVLRAQFGGEASPDVAARLRIAIEQVEKRRWDEEQARQRRQTEEERAREAAEARERVETAEAFGRVVEELPNLRAAKKWEDAVGLLAAFTEKPTLRDAATALLKEVQDEFAAYQSRTRELESKTRTLKGSGQLDELIRLLETASFEYPELPWVASMLQEARDRVAALALEQRQRLEAAFVSALASAAEPRKQRQWDQARRLLSPFMAQPETQSRAEAWLQELGKEENAFQAAVAKSETQARTVIATGDLRQAVVLLERAVAEFPEIQTFKTLVADTQKKLAAERRRSSIAEAEAAAKTLLAAEHFERVISYIDQLETDIRPDKTIGGVRALAVAGKKEKDEILQAVAQVAAAVEAGAGIEANRLLSQALKRFPNRLPLTELRSKVDEALSVEARRKAQQSKPYPLPPKPATKVAVAVESLPAPKPLPVSAPPTRVAAEPASSTPATPPITPPLPQQLPSRRNLVIGSGIGVMAVIAVGVLLFGGSNSGGTDHKKDGPRKEDPSPPLPKEQLQFTVQSSVEHVSWRIRHANPPDRRVVTSGDELADASVTAGSPWLSARVEGSDVVLSFHLANTPGISVRSYGGNVRVKSKSGMEANVGVTLQVAPATGSGSGE